MKWLKEFLMIFSTMIGYVPPEEPPNIYGTCKQCGQCCKWVAFKYGDALSPGDRRWLKYRGAQTVDGTAFFPNRCAKLGRDNKCKDYLNRPLACKMNPTEENIKYHPPVCRFFEGERSELASPEGASDGETDQ